MKSSNIKYERYNIKFTIYSGMMYLLYTYILILLTSVIDFNNPLRDTVALLVPITIASPIQLAANRATQPSQKCQNPQANSLGSEVEKPSVFAAGVFTTNSDGSGVFVYTPEI